MSIYAIEEVIESDFKELQKEFPELILYYNDDGYALISGVISFSRVYEDVKIEDNYLIEVTIPMNYPEIPPFAKEIGGRIPENFHKLNGGFLCLGVNFAVKLKFAESPSLIHFFDSLLIPYLYAYSYFMKFDKMPYGDAEHNYDEEYIFYSEKLFPGHSGKIILDFIGILAGNYRGHILCPCGSNLSLRKCHGEQLKMLEKHGNKLFFENQYKSVLFSVMKEDSNIEAKVIASFWTPPNIIKFLDECDKYYKNTVREKGLNNTGWQ
jgi:hypothetical protein